MRILKLGHRGTDVMKIQAVLKKIGYDPGAVDGVFSSETQRAVMEFETNYFLNSNGILDYETYRYLEPFLLGYYVYKLNTGDNLWDLTDLYNTTVPRILVANPGIDIYNLRENQEIVIPYGIDVVDTNIDYTYDVMEKDIKGLKARYPFLTVEVAGKSVLGRNLYVITLGKGPNHVFYNGAHHSLEWITSVVLMKFIENFSKALVDKGNLRGYDLNMILNQSTIHIMPMVNPDGIDLVLNGLESSNPCYHQLIQWNGGNLDFSQVWQANIRGVDLNHNYNASWEKSKEAGPTYGVFGPGPTRYPGDYPESEPESRAVADYTRANCFRLVLAYHSQGKEIYWTYDDLQPPEARRIGELFAEVSEYTLSKPEGIASYAGYKDWFIHQYRRPGYTIEVGLGKNPLSISQFNEIYEDNEELLILASIL